MNTYAKSQSVIYRHASIDLVNQWNGCLAMGQVTSLCERRHSRRLLPVEETCGSSAGSLTSGGHSILDSTDLSRACAMCSFNTGSGSGATFTTTGVWRYSQTRQLCTMRAFSFFKSIGKVSNMWKGCARSGTCAKVLWTTPG